MKGYVLGLFAVAAVSAPVFAGGRHCEALRLAVASNDVLAAEAAVSGVDWRGVSDPAAELRGLGRQVEGRPGFEVVARGLKTKLRLVTPGAKMDGSGGTMAVPVAVIPVVGLSLVEVPDVLAPVRIPTLPGPSGGIVPSHGGIGASYAPPEVFPMRVVTVPTAFSRGFSEWAARYGKRERFLNADGTEFEPDWGTSLHRLRQEMNTDTARFDALVDGYNERVERALWRKKMLREVR